MIQFLSTTSKPDYNSVLRKVIDGHAHLRTLKIAVAFWGKQAGVILQVMLDKIEPEKCQFICNLESGATNPDVIQMLKDKGIQVRSNPRIHAKVFLTGSHCILGSANLSSNGLGFEGETKDNLLPAYWEEVGILTDESHIRAEADRWFDGVWCSESTHLVEQADIDNAREMRKNKSLFISTDQSRDQIEVLKSWLDSGKACLMLWNREKHQPSKGAMLENHLVGKNSQLKGLNFYENWEKVNCNLIFDIESGKSLKATWWKNLPDVSLSKNLQHVLSAPASEVSLRFRDQLLEQINSIIDPKKLETVTARDGARMLVSGSELQMLLDEVSFLKGTVKTTELKLNDVMNKLKNESDFGGLIYITKGLAGAPLNFSIKGDEGASGNWRHGLKSKTLKWMLVYHKVGERIGEVWLGDWSKVSTKNGKYVFHLKNLCGPLQIAQSFKELTSKRPPENPVFAR